jgi:hypothetical protein
MSMPLRGVDPAPVSLSVIKSRRDQNGAKPTTNLVDLNKKALP